MVRANQNWTAPAIPSGLITQGRKEGRRESGRGRGQGWSGDAREPVHSPTLLRR